MRDALRAALEAVYAKRLMAKVQKGQVPRHIGVMVDGNRRWAKSIGLDNPSDGHRVGGAKIPTLLKWCDAVGIESVTLFLLSDDNLNRPEDEVSALVTIIDDTVTALAADGHPWPIKAIGALDLLPADLAARLKENSARTADRTGGVQVNVAVGYGGQREVADAVKSAIEEYLDSGQSLDDLAMNFDVDLISRHIYTAGQPPVDLIIRTSGEQRLSGFMLWQSVYAEIHFCECYWPDFRLLDFLRAMRSYSNRGRRFGR
ncbi:isoprenyl transferase [Streptomyces sp. NPDC001985]|uniref:isoprenyl transferase n=1 Tax=Streptomyces sp. NPDC001985 TaxID=3154406 RepID=UPI00332F9178